LNKTQVAGCCSARIIYDLGSEHEWKNGVKTSYSFDEFRERLTNTIKGTTTQQSSFSQMVFLAITNKHQKNEAIWLSQLGFEEVSLHNGCTMWHATAVKLAKAGIPFNNLWGYY